MNEEEKKACKEAFELKQKMRSPTLFAYTVLGIKLHRYQAEIAESEKNIIIAGGRQIGKSTVLAIKALHLAITRPRQEILIIAPTQRQSAIVYNKVYDFCTSNEFVAGRTRHLTMSEVRFDSQSIIRCLPAGRCIVGEEWVYTRSGIKRAKDVKIGDDLLGGKVSRVNQFEDDVYRINFVGQISIEVNKDHPFWVSNGYVGMQKKKDCGEWVTVEQMLKRKPRQNNVLFENSGRFGLGRISVGKRVAKLWGHLTSNGYSQANRKHATRAGIRTPPKKFAFAHGIGDTFGDVVNWVDDELVEFVRGYFNDDGCLSFSGKDRYLSFAVGINEERAYQLQYILWRLGVFSEVSPEWGQKATQWQYNVKVTGIQSQDKLLSILEDIKYPDKFAREFKAKRKQRQFREVEGGHLGRVKSIEYIGKKTVVGMTVEGENTIHSYCGMKTHNSGESIRGYAATMIIYDEAAFIPDEVFIAIQPAMAVRGKQTVLSGTPFGKRGYFYESYTRESAKVGRAKANYDIFKIPTSDNKFVTPDFLAEMKASMTKEEYMQEFEAEFAADTNAYFPPVLVMSGMEDYEYSFPTKGKITVGVDVARMGMDATAIAIVSEGEDGIKRLVWMETYDKSELTETAGRIVDIARKIPNAEFIIDETGVGSGVVDLVKERGLQNVTGVVFSLPKRTQMYNNLKLAFEQHTIKIPREDRKLASQFSNYTGKYTSDGGLMILKGSGHDDMVDALALCFSKQGSAVVNPLGEGWSFNPLGNRSVLPRGRFGRMSVLG